MNKSKIVKNHIRVLIVFCTIITFVISCIQLRITRTYIKPLDTYFLMQPGKNTLMISFGKKDYSKHPNYLETDHHRDMCGSPIYFFVDNTTGTPKIYYILFARQSFFDIHIPDYPYSIEKSGLITDRTDFSDYLMTLRKISVESGPFSDYPDHYVVWVQPSSYDKELEYWMYDLGDINDFESFINLFVKTPNYMSYSELKRDGVALGYQENIATYGKPMESKSVTVHEDNRKELIYGGWLFLDTMDIRHRPVLEMDKWMDDSLILSIIYRIGEEGEKVPVNGVRYVRWMDIQKWEVYYQ